MTPKRLSQSEFVALTAMLFASIAISIDAMLPALSIIGQEMSPTDPNRAGLVIGVFIFGMGIGTLFAGPLSDALGRKPVILWAFGGYILGALVAGMAQSLELLLLGRLVQGLAVAGPRIAAMAMVRDLYSGDRMASIMSFSMMVFGLVPAIAPSMGQLVMNAFGWRSIFYALALFATIVSVWMFVRQPETHPPELRKPLRLSPFKAALKEAFANRVFRYSVAVQTMLYAALFSVISTIQPIYEQSYDMGETFPLWFAAMAILAMPASLINAKIVARLGMRKIVKTALIVQLFLVCAVLIIQTLWGLPVWLFFCWVTTIMLLVGFSFGNLNALAMEPLGHIAGMAASISGAVSTVISAMLSIPVSLSFDGTPRTLVIGVFVYVAIAYTLMQRLGPREIS
ncbi:multidrug effflux MFS transporter [Aestuariibius sp. HNIBRBA575]|uniref:multidrug effflux MFS transporter n=1 Tax=Aestuariibius sp. HNIBRBA575 TaxID=3233343 RepID=UPI0034A2AFF3